MAIKYVRKTGSDSNAGTSAGAAYLTIGKLLQNLSAGDTGYIGSGIYRENALNPTNAGSAGNPITIVGDIDGLQTGDAGLVRITASADDNAYTNANVFSMTKDYITLDSLWCDMSSGSCIKSTGLFNIVKNCWVSYCKGMGIEVSGHDATITNCRVWNVLKNGTQGINLQGGNGIVDSCYLENISGSGACQGIQVKAVTTYLTVTVKNCWVAGIFPDGGSPDNGIYCDMNSIASAVANVYNNRVEKVKSGGANACEGIRFANCITGQTLNIFNNDIFSVIADAGTNNTYAIVTAGGSTPTTNGDYNMWADCRDGVSGYTANTHDKNNTARNFLVPPLPQGTAGFEMGIFMDNLSGGLDAGNSNSGNAPTTDMRTLSRPGKFGHDIGPIERQGELTKDASTFNTAAPATRIDGAGYKDFVFPVNNGKTQAIKLYLKTNASYSGTQPSATILSNTLGASGTISYTGASNAWQQVTIPTTGAVSADGEITVRVQGYSSAASSQFWVDDVTRAEA